MSSSRVQMTFAGALTAFEVSTASVTKPGSPRRPNPPPSGVVTTPTRSTGTPARLAARARHGLGGRGVEGLHLAAEYRAALDRGDQHARRLHVHAVDRPAVGLDRDVEAGDAFLADVAELVLRLQHRVLRHRQLRGFVHELPVHQSSSTRTMNDDTRLRFQLALRNVPLLRGGLLQHLAGGGAGLAPHLEA